MLYLFQGVTIPSQRRYVSYYDQLLKASPDVYKERMLFLKGMKFLTVPHHANLGKSNVTLSIAAALDVQLSMYLYYKNQPLLMNC